MHSNELICNILFYIDNNINNIITIDDLANEFYYNKFYIMKLFKKELNISIVEYINIKKIYNSLFFINTDNSILSCALLSGFNSQEYYTEIFKKTLGVSPSEYKKIINNEPSTVEVRQQLVLRLTYIRCILDKCMLYKAKLQPKNTPVKKLSIFN